MVFRAVERWLRRTWRIVGVACADSMGMAEANHSSGDRMSRYRSKQAVIVEAAKAIHLRNLGIHAVIETPQRAESVAEFVARGGTIERLPSPGDILLTDYMTVSNHG